MITQWIYQDQLLDDELIPEKSEAFIYLMTYIPTGKRYIGRKLLTKAHQYQKNKKIFKTRVSSDWREYYSSCPEILGMIEDGESLENFKREILIFCPTRGQANYLEEKFQYSLGVLESDDWYNTNIRAKMFKRNVKGKINTSLINNLLKDLMQVGKEVSASNH